MLAKLFEGLLRGHMGLEVDSVGPALIARAVQERQLSCNLEDAAAYWRHLSQSPAELQNLVEAVVVAETWFFRDREAFVALVREVNAHRCRTPESKFCLLSLPCATGEEPYSMAMALLDAGMRESQFSIDALDISERAIDRARHATFGSNAFRDPDLGFRERHFQPVGSEYQLSKAVQRTVEFRQANLMRADARLGFARYHAIFCRNLLIYLDAAARQRGLLVLDSLLHEGGHLFVGPAETSLLPSDTFVSLGVARAFAFRKMTRAERAANDEPLALIGLVTTRKPARSNPAMTVTRESESASAFRAGVPSRPPVSVALGASAHLAQVAKLADQGSLDEASDRCSEHLRLHGPSAALFALMGLLSEAAHEPENAASCHRKALYLDPNHTQSLVHLALLLEKHGDAPGAERLRRRARRLTQSGKT